MFLQEFSASPTIAASILGVMAFVEAVLLVWCAVRMRKGLPNPVPAARPVPTLEVAPSAHPVAPSAHPAAPSARPAAPSAHPAALSAHPVPALEVVPSAPRRGRQRRQPPPPPPRVAGNKLPDGDLILADQAF